MTRCTKTAPLTVFTPTTQVGLGWSQPVSLGTLLTHGVSTF
nr:MAG: hypothetical protein [Aspergillus flavus virga-like virus 1]